MTPPNDTDVRLSPDINPVQEQKSSKSIKLIGMISLISLATVYCGYTIAYIIALGVINLKLVYGSTAVIPVFRAFMIASLPFGIALGTFISKWVIPLSTRRNLGLIFCLIGIGLVAIIQIKNVAVFFVVRFFQGILVGFFLVLVPTFIKQLIPIEINKNIIFGVFQKLFVLIGFVLPFTFNTILLKKDVDQTLRWRIVVTVDCLPLVIMFILIITKVIPESPNCLIEKGNEFEAKKVIALFHDEQDVSKVYEYKKNEIQIMDQAPDHFPHKKKSKLKNFLTFEIPAVHQMTGVNAFISQMGFVTSQFNFQFSEYVPLMMTSVQLLTAILSMAYVTKVTPRKILLAGNLGMSLCCFVIGACLIVIQERSEAFWSIIAFLVLFMAFNGGTFIPAIGLYVADVGNRTTVRWSLFMNWFMCAWSIVIFITVGDEFGFPTVFMLFGIVSMIGFVMNAILMIETKVYLQKGVEIQLRPNKTRERVKT